MLSMQAPISGLGAAIPGAAALVPRVPCLPAPLQLSTLAAARLEGRPGPLLESERGLEPRARVRRDHDHRSIWSVTPPLIQPAACTFHGALRCGVQAARRTRSPSVSPPRVPAPHVSPHDIGEKSRSRADLSLTVQKGAGAGRKYCKARKAIGQRGQDFCAASTARA